MGRLHSKLNMTSFPGRSHGFQFDTVIGASVPVLQGCEFVKPSTETA